MSAPDRIGASANRGRHQTTEHLRGTGRALPDIARELHVDAVIEGSVLRAIADAVHAALTSC